MPTRHMERRQEDANTQLFDDFQTEFEMHYNLPEVSSRPSSTTQDSFVCRLTALMKLSENLVSLTIKN